MRVVTLCALVPTLCVMWCCALYCCLSVCCVCVCVCCVSRTELGQLRADKQELAANLEVSCGYGGKLPFETRGEIKNIGQLAVCIDMSPPHMLLAFSCCQHTAYLPACSLSDVSTDLSHFHTSLTQTPGSFLSLYKVTQSLCHKIHKPFFLSIKKTRRSPRASWITSTPASSQP